MIEIKRILCPVDFSEFAWRALDVAFALAQWYEAKVTALHVIVVPDPPPSLAERRYPLPFEPVLVAEEEKARLADELRAHAEARRPAAVPLDVVVTQGVALRGILEQARQTSADMIVLGSHGRSGFERLFLGALTEKVLRKAECPVLTVPRHADDTALAHPGRFKRILCPMDFSDTSLRALEYALSLAQEADAALSVLHVIEPVPAFAAGVHGPVTDPWQYGERAAREHLAALMPDNARTWCEIEELVTVGKPHQEVLRLAAERSADLIVLGVQGRGAVDLMLFGSTAHHIVRAATCPVLTIRSR